MRVCLELVIKKVYFLYIMVEFEFNEQKSHANRDKHGIDFAEAQKLWNDPELLEIPAKTTEEMRFLFIGRIRRKHWSAVVTRRNDKIRIISVRRARANEVEIYESQKI